ncbi:MAG TPA: polysaccharide biosynthesis tyrosine autokinase [Mycobacteriales bacterium]|nr:polysaccharide biosynthesis tyrosine autokinase [Mycobacteriales bacterium]
MDFLGVVAALRRRWLALFLCIIAGTGGGYDLGHHGTKLYRSTAQVLVLTPDGGSIGDQVAGTQLTSNLVATYAGLVNSGTVVARTISKLQAEGVNSPGTVSALIVPATYLINVSSVSPSPRIAQATADAASSALIDEVAALEQGLPSQITLHVATAAGLPFKPISPNTRLDLIVGIVLGVVGGLLLVALFEIFDRSVKSVHQADASLGVPMLGVVPKRRGKTLVLSPDSTRAEGEPYRSLRTAVRFLDPDRPLRTLLITSPTANDGKTTTVANLAVALALSGERVIVVDADLRRAQLAEAFGLERRVGLTSLVLGQATLDQALQDWRPNLKVLPSGPLPPNPSEILGSQFLNSLLGELSKRADIVILDAPPVLPVADAVTLGTQVDGVVIVVRHGMTPRGAAAAARRRLEAVGARLLGYVFNGVPRGETTGYYLDYRYGYSAKPSSVTSNNARNRERMPEHETIA